MHLVRTIGEPQRSDRGISSRQPDIVGHSRAAERLDRVIDHLECHQRRRDLDLRDLGLRRFVAALSIMSAAFSASRRDISMLMRASAIRSSHTALLGDGLAEGVRDISRLTIASSASSATPMVRMQ